MTQQEGVIKFRQDFREGPPLKLRTLIELNSWRRIL